MFTYPLIYKGDKPAKTVLIPGTPGPTVFQFGPLSLEPGHLLDKKYAHVTEAAGSALVKRASDLFEWPEDHKVGIVTREEFTALEKRLAALEKGTAKAKASEKA